MLKRTIALLLVFTLCLGMFPVQVFAEDTASGPENTIPAETTLPVETILPEETTLPDESVPDESGPDETLPAEPPEVTRAQWISALTKTFDMQILDDHYPDNYFSDLTEDSEYYYDLLLAVEFGVLDIPAGSAVDPDGAATRSFAVSTLNFCLGYQGTEDMAFTFSDLDAVSDPVSAQIAIDRGWLVCEEGAFGPEKPITAAEMDAMLADAGTILTSDEINEDHENTVVLSNGVVEVPMGTAVDFVSDAVLEVTDCPVNLTKGAVFVVYNQDMPLAFKALDVEQDGNITRVSYTRDGAEAALAVCDYEGVLDLDLSKFQPEDEDTTYSVQRTGGTGNPMARGIQYDEETQTLTVKKSLKISSGFTGNVTAVITNLKLEVKNSDTLGDYRYVLRGNATTTLDFTVKDKSDLLKPLKLGVIPVGGIGYITVELELNVSGTVALVWEGDIKGGFAYNVDHGPRLIHNYHKRNFTLLAMVEADLGVKVSAMIDVLLFQGSIYLKYGGKSTVATSNHYGQVPERCLDSFSYFYAFVGVTGKLLGITAINEPLFTIYDKDNSPYRTHYHYEAETADSKGKQVYKCTYSDAPAYYTPPSSENFKPTVGSGIWDSTRQYYYDLDDDDNAVITAYCGSSSVLVLPEMVDEYPVAGIEEYTFYGNPKITSIKLPDSLEFISASAFEGCTELKLVWTEGTNLERIDNAAFRDCTALQQFLLPDSVTSFGTDVFSGCTALYKINLPAGLSTVPERTFYKCSSLKTMAVPENTREIGEAAFYDCTALESINLNHVHTLGEMAFYNCTALKAIDMNDGWSSESKGYIFGNCSSLETIRFDKDDTEIKDYVFRGCTGLKRLTIPDAVTTLGYASFAECTGLRSLVLPDNMEKIPGSAFSGCTALTKVHLPEKLQLLGNHALRNCTSLETLTIPCGTRVHGTPFEGCTGLKTVTIAPGGQAVSSGLLYNCASVETVYLPDSIETIEAAAFSGCSSLHTLDLGGSRITSIGDRAFEKCMSMETFIMPDTVTTLGAYAFTESGMQEIQLSDTLEVIGECAFLGCRSLGKINIPASLKEVKIKRDEYGFIEGGTFLGCDNLKEVTIEEGLKTIPFQTFASCDGIEYIEIPASVTDIGAGAFVGCSNLKTVIFHCELTEIKDEVFGGADLRWLDLPQGVKKIGKSAFAYNHQLHDVRFPDALEEIGDEAFSNCSLRNVELPENLRSIGSKAFDWAENASWKIPKSLGSVGRQAFGWKAKPMILEEGITRIPSGLCAGTDITSTDLLDIPDTVTELGSNLFADCKELTEVTIPDSITELGSGIFRGCSALESVEIPDSVTAIGQEAFRDCTALKTVKLPGSLKVLERETFSGCSALEEITLPGNLTKLGYGVFGGVLEPTCLKRIYTTRNLRSIGDFYTNGTLEVYGVPGSFAEEWAASKEYPFYAVTEEPVEATEILWELEDMTLFAGDTWQIDPIPLVRPDTATSEITYTSSDPEVACFDGEGLLRAVAPGTADITASIDGLTADFRLTVVQPMSGVKLDVTEVTLDYGETLQLNASCDIEGTTNQDYIWTNSSNAAVDQNGLVTAISQGYSIITAKAADGSGNLATCRVTVRNTVKEVTDPRLLKVGNVDYQGNRYYPNNLDHMLIYRAEGVQCMTVVFHYDTYLEYNKDFLYVYDGNDQLIHTFTGWPNGSWRIYVPGDTVKLHMVTDSEGSDWGYEVVDVLLGSEFCDHSYTATQTGEPTCIKTAVLDYVCTLCGHRYQETIPALGHDYAASHTEATCTSDGYSYRTCQRCGIRHRHKLLQEAFGHNYIRELTHEGCEEGYYTHTCENCGDIYHSALDETAGHHVYEGSCTRCHKVFVKIVTQLMDVAVEEGETAELTVEAEGEGLTYQWYYKNAGSTDFLLTNAFTGPTYAVPMNDARHGRQVYCVITDVNGYSAKTRTATLFLGSVKLEIIKEPESVTVPENEPVWINVEATGMGLTYAWYYRDPGEEEFSLLPDYNSPMYYCYEMTEAMNGRELYCVITDQFGDSIQTVTVTSSISNDPLQILKDIEDVVAAFGETVFVTVEAAGVELTYQWYYRDPGEDVFTPSEGHTRADYNVTMDASTNGQQVYCVITDRYGNSLQTKTATLSMNMDVLQILKDIEDVVVPSGETATVTVEAAGLGLTYEWYCQDLGDPFFEEDPEATGNSYSVVMSDAVDGRRVYCAIMDQNGEVIWTSTVTLSMEGSPLRIITEPENAVAAAGETAFVNIKAAGVGLTYQWYYRDPGEDVFTLAEGYTADSYSATMDESTNGRQVYCVITDVYGNSIQTKTVSLHIGSRLILESYLPDRCVLFGETVSLTAEASGDDLTYAWYVKAPGSTGFSQSTDFTGPDYAVTMDLKTDGQQVYCIVTDRYGIQVQTNTATLTMQRNDLYIGWQSRDVQVWPGETAEASVDAYGDGLTYEWYFKNPGSTKFSKTNAFTGSRYAVTMSKDRDGRQVYCVITDQYGNQVQSEPVTLSMMKNDLSIAWQTWDVTVPSGEPAEAYVEAYGDGLTYEWYFKNPGSTKFSKTSAFTGPSYSVTMSAARDGRQVYCVITDQYGNQVQSEPVTLSMTRNDLFLLWQTRDVKVPLGDTAEAYVEASGDGLTYEWYFKNPGSSKFSKTSAFTGPIYAVTMTGDRAGRQVYCVITDQYGNQVQSEPVTLSMTIQIITQPQDTAVPYGQTVEVSVEAVGKDLTYAWYYATIKGGSGFRRIPDCNSPTCTISMAVGPNEIGYMVRCIISDPYGNHVTSNMATLTVTTTPLRILTEPQSVCVPEGEKAVVTVEAEGDGLTYAWYYKNPGASRFSLTDAFKGNAYSVTMTAARDGRQVYCVITDAYGNSLSTETAELTMEQPVGLEILTQPEGFTMEAGETGEICVEAVGDGLVYEWYYKNAASSKFTRTDTFTGPVYALTMNASRSGRHVYCLITDKYGNHVQTDTVTMNMASDLELLSQPEDVAVAAGKSAAVTVNAVGEGLRYTWYYRNPGSEAFTKTDSFTGDTYSLKMTEARSGRQVYCVVKDGTGNTVATDIVTLSIKQQ